MFYDPPLSHVTQAMMSDIDEETATLGWNLHHDDRISPQRFDRFWRYVDGSKIQHASQMWKAVSLYYDYCVHFTDKPDFLETEYNEGNFHGVGHLPTLDDKAMLVNIFNLGGLDKVYRAAKADGEAGFDSYLMKEKSGDPPNVQGWLKHHFDGLPMDGPVCQDLRALRTNRFLCQLLEYCNKRRLTKPFQPTWATLWDRFSAEDWKNPKRWQTLLGVRPSETETWLLLLCYPVREARAEGRPVLRPTQLDAGWYAEHFPVPPQVATGHAMELDGDRGPCMPLPEFIHQQIDHRPDHIMAIAKVEGVAAPEKLRKPAQKRHYGVLSRYYNQATQDWTRCEHPAFRP